MQRSAALVSVLIVVLGRGVWAAERPIDAATLVLKRTASGQERLRFVSNDPTFLFPTAADDPDTAGIVVEIFAAAQATLQLDTPPGAGTNPGWSATTDSPPRVVYRNGVAPAGPSSFRSIVLQQGRLLKLSGKRSGLDTFTQPLGSVGIRITAGSTVNCALFGPTTIRRDAGGTFVARSALGSALADCSDVSLGGLPVCGNGYIDGAEECDGAPNPGPFCPVAGANCFPPGHPDECGCCSDNDGCALGVACCDSEASCQVMGPPFSNPGTCYDPTCGPSDDCTAGLSCVDGTCCNALSGSVCFFQPSGGFIPCCPPLVCLPVGGGGVCG
jgi:hypothetical protein